jgi:hypothetical protein
MPGAACPGAQYGLGEGTPSPGTLRMPTSPRRAGRGVRLGGCVVHDVGASY